uniref:FH2 domain containing 2 n=1 Tax=Sinocyclocheilus anshuiensis TaxID=1608454 RepID=A0A671L0D4_9TELE
MESVGQNSASNSMQVFFSHFQEAVKKDKDLLMFPSRLSHVGPASRLSEESVVEDLSRLQSRVAVLRVRAQADAEIEQQTRTFLEVAEVRLQESQVELESLQKASKALVDFFCEDDKSFKLEEACLIFHCFCHRFQRAVQENTEREVQEQRRLARERENVEKRRSLALCTGLEAEQESSELEHALQRSLSYTGSRRSLRRLSQYFLRSGERNVKSHDTQHSDLHALDPEGFSRDSELRHLLMRNDADAEETKGMNKVKQAQRLSTDSTCDLQRDAVASPNATRSHSRLNTRTVPSENAFVALGKTSIMSHQQGAVNVLPLTGLSPDKVLKVEKPVQDASERLTQIETDTLKDAKTKECVNGKSQKGVTPQRETWSSASSPPEDLAQEPCSPERERVYPAIGETLECRTLVRALRSYESLSPTVTRPTTNHCSKWKKEREAEERDGTSSPHAKGDSRLVKTPTRGPTKRLLVQRGGPSNSSGIPRVRTKAEPTPVDGLSACQVSRPSPTCPSSIRTSLAARFAGVQNELKRNSNAHQRVNAPSDTGKHKGNTPEKLTQDKDKCQEPFVRSSPLRVSKRLAPNSESQSPQSIHSPSAATTAKTIRTAIISAAKAKTTKTPGTRIPKPAAQPMWR